MDLNQTFRICMRVFTQHATNFIETIAVVQQIGYSSLHFKV